MSSGGGGGGQNTTTQVQQIPEFAQDFSRENYDIARGISSQPYPTYQAPLIQGFSPYQQGGQYDAIQAGKSYQPDLANAENITNQGLDASLFRANGAAAYNAATNAQNSGQFDQFANTAAGATQGAIDPSRVNALSGMAVGQLGNALQTNAASPGAISSYMSPYVMASLAPQMNALNLQLGQQQKAIDSQATQSGAFGDARHGVAQATQNYLGNQAMNELVGTGYNNAYNAAMQGLQTQQQAGLSAAGQMGNLANLQNSVNQTSLSGANTYANLAGLANQQQQTQLGAGSLFSNLAGLSNQQQQTQLAGGQQMATLGQMQQQLGLTGAGALYTVGEQQQQQGQQELNSAYQQYLNQVNWPNQMLNIRESALSNNPYNTVTSVQLPQANTAAQGFGALTGLAGLLGGAASGGSGSRPNVFGAQ